MINISTEFNDYSYSFNRTLSSVIELPYNKSDIEIGVNELANGYNFNTSLDLLQSNLLYLYSVSKYANPDLPKQYQGWLGTYYPSFTDLNVTIRGNFFYSGVTFNDDGSVNTNSIPYFYISDKDGNNYNFVFTYNDNYNPKVEFLPIGQNVSFDISSTYNGNKLSVEAVNKQLTAYGFTSSYTEESNGILQLNITSVDGGVFFGNKNPETYSSLFGNDVNVTVTQGYSPVEFSIYNESVNDVLANPSNYDNLNNFSIAPGSLSGFNVLFLCSDNRIQSLSANLYSSDASDYTFLNYTETYGEYNKLDFLKINSSAYYNNSLYVSDELRNNVVRMNVTGFTKSGSHRFNKFYETEIIGGEGEVRDNYSFRQPKIVDFYNGYLYVLDQGNQMVKVYDEDLGFVRNIRKAEFYKLNPPVSVKLFNDKFYWLTKEGKLTTLDLNLNVLTVVDVSVNSTQQEEFLDLVISPINNIFYVLTRTNVYKYFTDNETLIGVFDLTKMGIPKKDVCCFQFMNLIESKNEQDLIYIYRNTNGRGMLLGFLEDENYLNLLSDYNFDIYSKDELHLNKEEFASSLAYNKSLYKILNNTLQLRNFIYRKVNADMNNSGALIFAGITYFDPSELPITNYKTDMNNYIGTNEIFSRAVVNRVLNKVLDLQLQLLTLFKTNITPPPRKSNYLESDNNGLMLETFPLEPSDYFVLENSESSNDYILQEYALIPQNNN